MLGVAGAAALSISVATQAQAIDDRPILYVMLKSLESGFKSYNDDLVAALESKLAAIRARYESQRAEIAAEIGVLEAERERRVSAFTAERDALSERIEALGEQISLRDGRISERRRINGRHADDPKVKSLTDALAAEGARLAALESEYRAELEATRKARAVLTRQFEEYTSAGDPLALEIRSLEEEWQRFAEGERRELKNLADSYAEEYAAYNDWLESERAALGELGQALAGAVETDREQRARHARLEVELRALIDRYNALVEQHNAAGADDPGRDDRAARFAEMEKRIAVLQSDLVRARETVVEINEKFRAKKTEYDDRYAVFVDEKRAREARLAAELARINAARAAVEKDIDARRDKVEAQIRALESQISAELEGARSDLETRSRHLVAGFGRDYEGLDDAIARFLEKGDDRLLYTEQGAPRFDLSSPKTAAIYRSVERMLADRRRIDARIVALDSTESPSKPAAGGAAPASAALERERAALGSERQQLLEAHASFAREHQSRLAALEQRLDALDARVGMDRARLEELYSLRADTTRSEFQLVQQALVAAIRGQSRTHADPGEHAKLVEALREKSSDVAVSGDASMAEPHALLGHIASGLPAGVGEHAGWTSFTGGHVAGDRTLTSDEKTMVASAWLARYRRQPRFATIAEALERTGAVANAEQALATLFIDGVVNHTTIDELRLEDGRVGIRVGVLGRAYELREDGSLARLPDG